MKRNRRQAQPECLGALAAQAKDYALHMMRTTGSVPPTVIADTDAGYVFCMPTALADEAAKDRFAEVTRLFAIAQNARALVMIVEAWANLPDANGHLDTVTPPTGPGTCSTTSTCLMTRNRRWSEKSYWASIRTLPTNP